MKAKSIAKILILVFTAACLLVGSLVLYPMIADAATAPSGYTGNGTMAYINKGSNRFDVKGYHNGTWVQTTFANNGYTLATNMGDASITSSAEFVNGGKGVQLNYTVTATQNIIDGKLAVYADVMIANNDRASIEVIKDAGEVIGIKLVDYSTDAQFSLYFSKTGGVTDASTYWFGRYGDRQSNAYNQLSYDNKSSYGTYSSDLTKYSNGDSGFATSWQNINLAKGESRTYSIMLVIGKNAEPPKFNQTIPLSVNIDNFAANKTIDVVARVTDAVGETDSLYYAINGGTEQLLGSVAADGTEKEIAATIDFSNLSAGNYTVSFWLVNSSGVSSSNVTRTFEIKDESFEFNDGYSFKYDLQGGLNEDVPRADFLPEGTVVTVTRNYPTKLGHTFEGWNSRPDGSGTAYTAGQQFTLYGDTTLYAVWEPIKYNVTWYINGVSYTTQESYGTIPSYEGAVNKPSVGCYVYTFTGWSPTLQTVTGTASYTANFEGAYVHTPGPESCTEQQLCLECGEVLMEIRGHDIIHHSEKPVSCENIGWNAYDTCTRCDYSTYQEIAPIGHEYKDEIVLEPTCTKSGYIKYPCTRCNHVKTTVIPALNHDIVTEVEKKATCTENGLIVDECQRADCEYRKETVIYGAHSFEVSERQEAKCEENGYVLYACKHCDDTYREPIEAGHNYVESDRLEAAVEQDGYVEYACTACGDVYRVIIPGFAKIEKNSAVLLIQDVYPWSENNNVSLLNVLKNRGVVTSYNIISSTALESYDLTQYGIVMIANDQNNSMYQNLSRNSEKLENYAKAGGVLIYGACDMGWGGGSISYALPGGVVSENYYSVHNYIANGLHPIITGVNTDGHSVSEDYLKGNYCSHTYFIGSTLPEGTDVILRDANGNATLVEYQLGEGTVIASGLTWEFFYTRSHYNMTNNYSKCAFDDLVTYAVVKSGIEPCEHEYGEAFVVNASCTTSGYTLYVCGLCGHENRVDVTEAFGHSFGEWFMEYAPTCTVDGTEKRICETCNSFEEKSIAKIGHSYELGETKPASCFEEGVELYCCSNCYGYKTEIIPKLNHDYVFTNKIDAGCGVDGQMIFNCSVCQAERIQILPSSNHSFGDDCICDNCGLVIESHQHNMQVTETVPSTCTTFGYVVESCTDCAYTYRTVIDTVSHSWQVSFEEAATCTMSGIIVYNCSNCPAVRNEIVPAHHTLMDNILYDASCTEDGLKEITCINCDYRDTEVIPAHHTWGEAEIIEAATCESTGKAKHVCSVCCLEEEFTVGVLGHQYENGVCVRCGEFFIDNITRYDHKYYGMYFKVDEVISGYGPGLVDEYGVMLDCNEDAQITKVAVYLIQEGTMWRRCIAVKGSNIQYANYVPYLSYKGELLYSGLNSEWINVFPLSENSDGIWCYNDYVTIGANLSDKDGNLLLSLFDLGEAGKKTIIFDNLQNMLLWLDCDVHQHADGDEGEVVLNPTCNFCGIKEYMCTLCGVPYSEEIEMLPHEAGEFETTTEATDTENGTMTQYCEHCGKVLATETIPSKKVVLEDKFEEIANASSREEKLDLIKAAYEAYKALDDKAAAKEEYEKLKAIVDAYNQEAEEKNLGYQFAVNQAGVALGSQAAIFGVLSAIIVILKKILTGGKA